MDGKDQKKVLLGNRIRELREKARLSREEMAAAAGVSRARAGAGELSVLRTGGTSVGAAPPGFRVCPERSVCAPSHGHCQPCIP